MDYGLRYEIDSPIRESAKRTSGPVLNGAGGGVPGSQFLINPQPGYKLDKKGLGPRLALRWHAAKQTQLLAAAGITTGIPNLWNDNFLTGATPFVLYPRDGRAGSPGPLRDEHHAPTASGGPYARREAHFCVGEFAGRPRKYRDGRDAVRAGHGGAQSRPSGDSAGGRGNRG
jgi:hypothetical protein